MITFESQIYPFQELYTITKVESHGQMGRMYSLEIFNQHMKEKEFVKHRGLSCY